ncbi:MAG TPA: TolC family protein [Burkholderiales bacterium]|nr:TolC family protein [Burkholderiales bacterium]
MNIRIWLVGAFFLCNGALASGLNDPFSTESMTSASPCSFTYEGHGALSLADVVEHALCNNPQTRVAWANARAQAAQVGIAESAYLPTLNASINSTENRNSSILSRLQGASSSFFSQTGTTLSLSYLLYDFGARNANLESARETLIALNETRDATIQSVFLSAVQAYYGLFANQASVGSALESEKSSLEGLNAASTRRRIGTATLADELQAKTAYQQAVLNRITAQGNEKTAEGVLANTMGMDADHPLEILPPRSMPDEHFEGDLKRLIDEAKHSRPDLKAAEAQLAAAKASVDAAAASGMPTIKLNVGQNYTHSSIYDPYRSTSFGVTVNMPIFTGFNTTYQIRAAEAQAEASSAARDKIAMQVSLDVWKAYQTLATATNALKSTSVLLESATQSEQVAMGRYKAGVGLITDLLTAEAALASARQQRVQAMYNWQMDKAALAQAVGVLNEIPKKDE